MRGLLVVVALFTASCGQLGAVSSFTLEFPSGDSLGTLSMVEDVNCFTCGTGREDLGPASGRVHVQLPAWHWYVSLKMPKDAARRMSALASPSLASLGDLNLEGSDVTDDDLRYVSGLHLRSINLSHTMITGAGLKYLNAHPKWTWVDLQECPRLDVDTLSHFKGWKRATIRVLPSPSSRNVSQPETALLERVRHVVCGDQPEDVCGTQIR
jgi:hypothetical protein